MSENGFQKHSNNVVLIWVECEERTQTNSTESDYTALFIMQTLVYDVIFLLILIVFDILTYLDIYFEFDCYFYSI